MPGDVSVSVNAKDDAVIVASWNVGNLNQVVFFCRLPVFKENGVRSGLLVKADLMLAASLKAD